MVLNEIPFRYYNAGVSANTAYLVHTINTTEKSTSISSDRSTNFLKIDVTFISGTGASVKTLSATLHLCISAFNPGSTYFNYFPIGPLVDYEFPIGDSGGTKDQKYTDLKYPDEANFRNYFMISFSVESGADIGVYINTPNVNGKLLVETTQIFFKV